ncbi:zinc finger swim domain-containing protein [Anaeramoeba flamelloides]|uniref:Zinc finger swim domain-containing protein n=1 Tax=Anaeramoeba flamelloides TaxID=1746091 RepID=A0ABQ8X766_9EUKA|nr:zinc finger swim domain-containing protein [Anaeramoeba flamelloides]
MQKRLELVDEIFKKFEKTKKINNEVLLSLKFFFPNVLESAIEIVDTLETTKNQKKLEQKFLKGDLNNERVQTNSSSSTKLPKVVLFETEKSKRSFVRFESFSRNTDAYLIYPHHYCSCPDFHYNVINRQKNLFCKHILAVRIASTLGLIEKREIKESEYLDWINQFEN